MTIPLHPDHESYLFSPVRKGIKMNHGHHEQCYKQAATFESRAKRKTGS